MLKGKKEFVAALVVIVIVLLVLAFPYALIATYGLKVILLIQLVVLPFFCGMLVWWLVRYRQTSHDIETLRDEIDRKICGRDESEHDASEGRNKRGHKRK